MVCMDTVKMFTSQAESWQAKAEAAMRVDDYEQAIYCYTRALSANPCALDYYDQRADCHYLLGQYAYTLADCDRMVGLAPNTALPYNKRGIAQEARCDLDYAFADFSTAISIEPDYATAYNNRGYIYALLRQPEMAMADYEQAIALDRRLVAAYVNRADLYHSMGQSSKAMSDYDQAVRLDPECAVAYINRSLIRLRLSVSSPGELRPAPLFAAAGFNVPPLERARILSLRPDKADSYRSLALMHFPV